MLLIASIHLAGGAGCLRLIVGFMLSGDGVVMTAVLATKPDYPQVRRAGPVRALHAGK